MVAWYINDTKLSRMGPVVNNKIIEYPKKHFEELEIIRGEKHIYIGMNITIR